MLHDIAFLHTSPVHVTTFDELMQRLAPELRVAHSVREDLLNEARRVGADSASVVARVRQAVAEAGASGASIVVCTCSTLGSIVEDDRSPSFQTIRIDRAMADQAVRGGGRVLLVAALAATLSPTTELLQASADRLGVEIAVEPLLVPDAWAHFEAGRHDGYIAAIVASVANAPIADAGILGQASMAPAAELLATKGIHALTSPALGVAHAVALYRQRQAAG
jgi:hypothetical protein